MSLEGALRRVGTGGVSWACWDVTGAGLTRWDCHSHCVHHLPRSRLGAAASQGTAPIAVPRHREGAGKVALQDRDSAWSPPWQRPRTRSCVSVTIIAPGLKCRALSLLGWELFAPKLAPKNIPGNRCGLRRDTGSGALWGAGGRDSSFGAAFWEFHGENITACEGWELLEHPKAWCCAG